MFALPSGFRLRAGCGRPHVVHEPVLKRASPIALLAVLSASHVVTPQSRCDTRLVQPANNPYGYRWRGDRCEGVYIQDVAATPLLVASWTESFEDYDLASKDRLMLEWDAPAGGQARIVARGLRRRLYFQMDTLVAADRPRFAWSPDVLSGLGIRRQELGVFGIVPARVGTIEQMVYVPLRVRQRHDAVRGSPYALVVVPGVELQELFVTLMRADGKDGAPLKNAEPLRYGYYPADRPIDIPVRVTGPRGLYHLQLGATHRDGAVSTADLWFYHAR